MLLLRAGWAAALVGSIVSLSGCARRAADFDVRRFGTAGDGRALDTAALNQAVDACAAAGGGRVVVPAGRYLTGTVRLRSNVTLHLECGAELIGTSDLDRYDHFTPPVDTPLIGGSTRWHRAIVLADGAENVAISGTGIIDGAKVSDPLGEEYVRGPHAVLFGNCRNVTVSGVTIKDAGNYALLLEFTSGVRVDGIKVAGGYDGVHLRGWEGRPCRDVRVSDCEFYTGDDCIAGWHWDDVRVERCTLNSSCNGVRLFGPARDVVVSNCHFFGPGKYPWRTAPPPLRLTNMASGVCIHPSAWGDTPGEVDDLHIIDVDMRDVATPVHVVAKSPSTVGYVTVERLSASGVYRAAASFESWTGEPMGRVDLRDVDIRYTGRSIASSWSSPLETARTILAATRPEDVRPPGTNSRPLPAWGLYARHVRTLHLENVRLSVNPRDARPAVLLDGVDTLESDPASSPSDSVVMKNVRAIVAKVAD
jgi:polygalacturonase